MPFESAARQTAGVDVGVGGYKCGYDSFAPLRVELAKDDCVFDLAGAMQGGFDFGWEDIFAAADNFAAGSTGDMKLTLQGEIAEVVGVKGLG